MADNVHPVVELLAARMESHPEEFQFHAAGGLAVTGRWETWINQLGWHFNEAEKELIYGKAKELIFQRIHEEVLDELLNGEERRAQEKRERELEMQRLMAQAQQQSAAQRAAQLYSQQNAIQPGQYTQVSSLGALQGIQSAGTLRLGSETIDEGMIRKIKKALGV